MYKLISHYFLELCEIKFIEKIVKPKLNVIKDFLFIFALKKKAQDCLFHFRLVLINPFVKNKKIYLK